MTDSFALFDKYQKAMSNAGMGLWEWNFFTDVISFDTALNKLYEIDDGVTPLKLTGQSYEWYLSIHEDDREMIRTLVIAARNDLSELDSMFRINLKNGGVKYIRTQAYKIRDENNKVIGLVGLNWDVTRESVLQNDLTKTKMFLEKIMDAIPDPVFVKDRDHTWLFGNHAFEDVVGIKREDFIGKNDYDFFPKEYVDVFWEKDDEVMRTGISNENEEQVLYKKSEVRDVLTKKTVAQISENEKLLVGVIRDITEMKRIQKSLIMQSKMASLGEMSAQIAHEINNPLTIIQAKAQMLIEKLEKNDFEPDKILKDLQLIENNSLRIDKIIKSLKSISRHTENDPFDDVSIIKIANDTYEIAKERFKKNDINFELHIDKNISANDLVKARHAEIVQVLMNLLNNAFDAVFQRPSPWVKLHFLKKENYYQIEVMDSGTKIPVEIAKKLMQPFFTTKPTGLGTGIGLSLSKQIIELHQGEFYYDTEAPNTRFVFTLKKLFKEA